MNHHLLPRYRNPAPTSRTNHAHTAATAILETGQRLPSADDQLYRMGRDESYLRGIPAIGRNAPSVCPGTMPGCPSELAIAVATVIG